MKKHVLFIYILMSLCVLPLIAKKRAARKRAVGKQATAFIPSLNEIVIQSSKIIDAQSPQLRIEEKKNLLLLVKESQLDRQARAKIAYAISIILRTTPQTMQLSQEAYSFLMALLEVQEAQQNVITVAQEIKTAVAVSPAQERQRVIDAAIKQLESVAQEAQATIDNARVRIDNMMNLSEIMLDGKMASLKDIVEKAGEIIAAKDEQMRSEAQQEFADLIKKLDKNIRDAMMPDFEAIQNITDETRQKAQEAYDRLLTMTLVMDQEITDMVLIVEKERESIENEPISSFRKIGNFIANKMSAVENFVERILVGGNVMLPIGYIEKQSVLIIRIGSLLKILSESQDKDLRVSAESDLKSLMLQEDLDDKVKSVLNPLIEKLNNGELLTKGDVAIAKVMMPSPNQSTQFEILESILKHASYIYASFVLTSPADWISLTNSPAPSDKKLEEEKRLITAELNYKDLYQKIKDALDPDVQIILNTTPDTLEQSKQAFARLGKTVNGQRSFGSRAERMVRDQASKLFGLVPESIKKIAHDYPIITGTVMTYLAAEVISRTVIRPYKNWAYNYKLLQGESNYFYGVLRALQKAEKEGDDNKKHILMGTLEGLGLEFTEGWETTNKRLRLID